MDIIIFGEQRESFKATFEQKIWSISADRILIRHGRNNMVILVILATIGLGLMVVFSLVGFILIGKALNDNGIGNDWDDMEDDYR